MWEANARSKTPAMRLAGRGPKRSRAAHRYIYIPRGGLSQQARQIGSANLGKGAIKNLKACAIIGDVCKSKMRSRVPVKSLQSMAGAFLEMRKTIAPAMPA